MTIALACDHTAVSFKKAIIEHFETKGYVCKDFGTHTEEMVDYPLYGIEVANAVVSGTADKGVVICGTGIGMSLVCNKVAGVRCVLCNEHYSARMAREHNDANVIALGARVIGIELAKDLVDVFLSTEFADPLGRHQPRLDMIQKIEQKQPLV